MVLYLYIYSFYPWLSMHPPTHQVLVEGHLPPYLLDTPYDLNDYSFLSGPLGVVCSTRRSNLPVILYDFNWETAVNIFPPNCLLLGEERKKASKEICQPIKWWSVLKLRKLRKEATLEVLRRVPPVHRSSPPLPRSPESSVRTKKKKKMKRRKLSSEQSLGQKEAGNGQTPAFQVPSKRNRLHTLTQVERVWHAYEARVITCREVRRCN